MSTSQRPSLKLIALDGIQLLCDLSVETRKSEGGRLPPESCGEERLNESAPPVLHLSYVLGGISYN